MHRSSLLLLLFWSSVPPPRSRRPSAVQALPAQMRYDVTELHDQARCGREDHLRESGRDAAQHRLLPARHGRGAACNKQMEKPDEALKRNWLPEDPGIWLHSKTLNPHEKEEFGFKAPEKPGIYPFVCSMPGHAMIMHGRLNVFAPAPQLSDLKFKLYLGDWKKLPDFGPLQAHREGDLAGPLIEFKLDDYKNQFGVVFRARSTRRRRVSTSLTWPPMMARAFSSMATRWSITTGFIPRPASRKESQARSRRPSIAPRVLPGRWGGGALRRLERPEFGMTPLSKWVPANWKGAATGRKNDGDHRHAARRREGAGHLSQLHLRRRQSRDRRRLSRRLQYRLERREHESGAGLARRLHRRGAALERSRRRRPASARVRRFSPERRAVPSPYSHRRAPNGPSRPKATAPRTTSGKATSSTRNVSPPSFTGGAGSPSRSALKPPAMPRPVPAS